MGENSSHTDPWLVNSSIDPQFRSRLSPSADLLVAMFLIFTGVSSMLGNGTVLLVYYRKRKTLKPAELMTVNLAVCDFGFSFMGLPFFIISSLSHAWVFGETGCIWYGIQGSVFGIGSLITTSLISLDRCLKICCLRYGLWINSHHVSVCVAVIWIYTVFLASLPVFGFGSYRPEPYGTSCTVNWWGLRSSHSDRMYVYLFLSFGFGLPTITIIASYVGILLKVYLSNRTLASIPCSTVSKTSTKDLKLAKMAVVVCVSFLVAWLPYASVSMISALISGVDQDPTPAPYLLNWTFTEPYKDIYHSLDGQWGNMTLSSHTITEPSLSPIVTLIPAMFAKSHCMMNPIIYQIMHRKFRDSVYEVMFGRVRAEDRGQRRNTNFQLSSARISYNVNLECMQSGFDINDAR